MKKVRTILALLLVLALSLMGGCGTPADTSATAPAPSAGDSGGQTGDALPIKIGVFMRYNDDTGAQMRAVMTLAFEKLNEAGGVDGHPLDVIFYDTDGDTDTAVSEYNRMVSEDKVHIVIGPTTSTNALAVTDLAVEYEMPTITPQSTNTAITSEYANEWFFRNSVADCYQSYSLCDYIVDDMGLTKIAFIHSADSQGKGQFDDFSQYLKETYDMDIFAEQSFNEGDIDFKSQLIAVKNANPEIIVFAGHEAEIALLTSQRLEVGIPADLPFAGYNAMTSADYSTVAGPACEGVILASPWSPTASDEASKKFLEEYASVLTNPDANSALAYDCVQTVAYALTGLELGLTDDTLAVDRLAIRDSLASIKGFPNLTGTVNYGPGATQQDKDAKTSCAIWQMQDDYSYTLLKAAA